LKATKRKILIVVAVSVVALAVIASSLAYYYQPVRGTGYASSTDVLLGENVEFDFSPTQGIGPYEYLWAFGDGTYSHEKNPTHAYEGPGTYKAFVNVQDAAGKHCAWFTDIIVRLPPPSQPMVFIDDVSYPSTFSNPSGDSYFDLYVDGKLKISHSSTLGVTLEPGTNPELHIWFYWYAGDGYYVYHGDFLGHLAVPSIQTDLHCVLHCDPQADPKFWLIPL